MFDQDHFPYLPHTDEDRKQMLAAIGVRVFEDLLKHVPKEVRAANLDLPPGLSELELTEHIGRLASRNIPASAQSTFLGGGAYRRYVPAAVQSVVSRSEFATAYTPYQPEVSQGTLQAIYEFQTAICLLTGMEVANASMYDGPTAGAEAALMACRLTGRNKVVLADTVNPEYRLVTRTYAQFCGLALDEIRSAQGSVSAEDIHIGADCAAVVVQYPNYFGILENIDQIAAEAHKQGALLIVVSDPIALAVLTSPGDMSADIVVGDAQQCGNSLSFGGPSAGYLATKMQFVRQVPGRLCGMTVDNSGRRAFTLTLQTREQHIRRAKATSNICTNQALNALTMLVYLTMMGPGGLEEVAKVSFQRAHHLSELLANIDGVKLAFDKPFLNEFVIQTEKPADYVLDSLKDLAVLGGIDICKSYPSIKNGILVAVTEMNSAGELIDYANKLSIIARNPAITNPAMNSTKNSSKNSSKDSLGMAAATGAAKNFEQ